MMSGRLHDKYGKFKSSTKKRKLKRIKEHQDEWQNTF